MTREDIIRIQNAIAALYDSMDDQGPAEVEAIMAQIDGLCAPLDALPAGYFDPVSPDLMHDWREG